MAKSISFLPGVSSRDIQCLRNMIYCWQHKKLWDSKSAISGRVWAPQECLHILEIYCSLHPAFEENGFSVNIGLIGGAGCAASYEHRLRKFSSASAFVRTMTVVQ